MPQSRAPQQSCGRLQASFGGLQSGPPNKKMAASVTLRPLYYPKAIQEQQTQGQSTTGGGTAQVISSVVCIVLLNPHLSRKRPPMLRCPEEATLDSANLWLALLD